MVRKLMRLLAIVLILSIVLAPCQLFGLKAYATSDIIIDNSGSGYTEVGSWNTSGLTGCYGTSSRYNSSGSGADYATWTPTITTAGMYDIYVYFPSHDNRARYAPLTIYDGSSTVYYLNQSTNGSEWLYIGTHYLPTGSSSYVRISDDLSDSDEIGSYVGADAVKFSPSSQVTPSYANEYVWSNRNVQVLFDADTQSTQKYASFPSISKQSDTEVLISYKRGNSHYQDDGDTELIKFNATTESLTSRTKIHDSTYNDQNSEILEMPNGDLVIYIDKQSSSSPVDRYGLVELRSTDSGQTWVDNGLVDLIGGVRYAYSLDTYIDGSDVYMLCMTFSYIENSGPRAVHVIKSSNSGSTWSHVKNLTAEFSYQFNESTLEKVGNNFIIVGRSDDYVQGTRIFKTDANFNVVESRNLTHDYDCVYSLQRPKLFLKDNELHLIARDRKPNYFSNLNYYLLDYDTLGIDSWAEIYGTIGSSSADSHYAEEYFITQSGTEYFNIINYAPHVGSNPDIVRYEFVWDDLKDVYNQDFNSSATNSIPIELSYSNQGGTVGVSETPSSADKSLRLNDTSTSYLVDIHKEIESSSDAVTIEYEAMISQNNQTFAMNLRDDTGTQAVTIIFSNNGYIQTYNAGVKTNLVTYSSNSWIDMRIVADSSTDKFDVYVGGTKVASSFSFRNNVSNISDFRFNSIGSSTGSMYIDDIVVN